MPGQKTLYQKGFTLVELLVVISIIALLLAILMPALGKAREQGQKVVCMSNTKQLQLGWSVYAENNNGKLVFGSTTRVRQSGWHKLTWQISALHSEPSWVACPWYTNENEEGAGEIPPAIFNTDPWYNDELIKMGTLYSTVRDLKAYRCPVSAPWSKNKSRSYAISSRMNGYNGAGEGALRESIKFKTLNNITAVSDMMVFICQGGVFPDDYGYECFSSFAAAREWRDLPPPVHMGKTGTPISFADGHSDYWKWNRAKEYVKYLSSDSLLSKDLEPIRETDTNRDEDFDKVYSAIWGKRRY
jgi:prepilin-type N-terminal cleavage/methylation domain-containing protein